jgi:hypothetical protein
MKCFNCKEEITGKTIKAEPNRHMQSPNSINHGVSPDKQYFNYYCSEICRKETDRARYRWFADIDRNASDSECFIHDHWEVRDVTGHGPHLCPQSWGVRVRVGHCKITGNEVVVIPLMPAEASGQPKECTEHFVLRKNYRI